MVLGLEGISLIAVVQSILLIISALLIIIAAIGILRMDNDMPNVVYARIHILGIVDVAGIIAFLALGQPLFALIYLFLAPLLAHALANGYYHGEDEYNNPVINPDLLNEESSLGSLEDESADSQDNEIDGSIADESADSQDNGSADSLDEKNNDSSDSLDDADEETAENDDENLNDSEGDGND